MTYTEGTVVHIDTDNAQWGRVVGRATVLETPKPGATTVLVAAESVRATILVPKCDISPEERHDQP